MQWKEVITIIHAEFETMKLANVLRSEVRMPKHDDDFEIKDIKEWLSKFQKACVEVRKARALVPEETWANYQLYEVTGLREQNIFDTACGALKRIWSSRPASIRKKKNVKPKNKD